MKKKLFFVAGAALLTLASCKDKSAEESIANDTIAVDSTATEIDATATAEDTTTNEENADRVPKDLNPVEAVAGTVSSIVNGKDGYTATVLNTKDSIVYDVVISIPNLKDPKQFRRVKTGERIMAIGEKYEVGKRLTIKASSLR